MQLRLLLLITLLLALAACSDSDTDRGQVTSGSVAESTDGLAEVLSSSGGAHSDDLDAMRERGVLRALVTYSRTDFFIEHGRIRGIQADFLRALEAQLNAGIKDHAKQIRIHFLPVSFDQLIPALEAGLGDVAAAFLTITPERQRQVAFASGKRMKVDEIVVSHTSAGAIASLEDLAGKEVYVLRNSSYAEHLRELNKKWLAQGLLPMRIIQADAQLLSEDILELVNAGVVPITVIDSYRAKLWAKVMPDLVLHEGLQVSVGNRVGWAVRKDNPLLQAELGRFISSKDKGTLTGNMLFREYFSNPRWISDPNSQKQRDRLEKHLPLFRKYALEYGFDELALAAQAFQESGLRQDRKSHRGAVGIMQLLPSTAADKSVAIPDISSVEANIHAGAKYLAFLRDRYFSGPTIGAADRRAFSWAAYNAGPANVRKMRKMTKEMGLNVDVWFGNVEIAAARLIGRETVTYVANIAKYYVAYQLARQVRERKQSALEASR